MDVKPKLNKDGRERKTHEVTLRREKAEKEAKTGHLKGDWAVPNDSRIDI